MLISLDGETSFIRTASGFIVPPKKPFTKYEIEASPTAIVQINLEQWLSGRHLIKFINLMWTVIFTVHCSWSSQRSQLKWLFHGRHKNIFMILFSVSMNHINIIILLKCVFDIQQRIRKWIFHSIYVLISGVPLVLTLITKWNSYWYRFFCEFGFADPWMIHKMWIFFIPKWIR